MHTILVEPHPATFASLNALLNKERELNANVTAVNAAVCSADEKNVTFYTLKVEGGSNKSSYRAASLDPTSAKLGAGAQFSSMSLQHVLDHMWPQRCGHCRKDATKIERLHVPCYSVATMLARHGVAESALRILTVDAEGADVEILEGVPWGRVLPRLLVFELTHVQRQPSGRRRTQALLELLSSRHRYACQEQPPSSHGSNAGVSPDVWCVHAAARELSDCEAVWLRKEAPGGRCWPAFGARCGW